MLFAFYMCPKKQLFLKTIIGRKRESNFTIFSPDSEHFRVLGILINNFKIKLEQV